MMFELLNKRRLGLYIPETRDERVYKDVKKYIEDTPIPQINLKWQSDMNDVKNEDIPQWLRDKIKKDLMIIAKQFEKDQIEQRLKNLTSKEIADATIEFSKWLDRQGWGREETFFKHNDEIKKKERELFWWRYPPYLKIKTFRRKTNDK